MSERYPNQEPISSEEDVIKQMSNEDLIEFITSNSEKIMEIKSLTKIAVDTLDSRLLPTENQEQ